jgi:transposase
MGLLMDEERVPIAYKLFRGNTHDASTLVPIIDEFKATFGINKIKLVADKGLNSKTNLKYLIDNGHQFIVSQKVRGTTKDFKEKVLSDDGYKWNENKTYKSKEFL